VYSRSFRDYNIWRMPLPAGGNPAGAPAKFLASTRYEESPAWSPDGKRIAFSSNRAGVRQIWVADADGSNTVALTNFADGIAGSPRWSPDGQSIVFDARPSGAADVYSVRADGGIPKRLTDHPAEDHVPCYSADGRWIYFASLRAGQEQLFRIPATGGAAVQITRHGGYAPIASPDGKWIYYEKDNGLRGVPVGGGEETQVLEAGTLLGRSGLTFCVNASGIYFAVPSRGSMSPLLKRFRFQDSKTEILGQFDKPPIVHISVSPDEKSVLYTQLDHAVDELMLVENFR
jgi:Tol biopolymer transport system component